MARLKNSSLDKTVNRKALTFATEVVSNVVNTNLEQLPADTTVDLIDAAGLESEQSAADKLGFMIKMISAVKADLLCKLTPYEVICHAMDIPTAFSVPDNTTTIIPFTTLLYTPSTGTYSAPTGFQVAKSGYYDVDAAFQNYSLTTPTTRVFLNIGTSAVSYQVDDVIMGTEIMRLQGSMKIWCEKDDYIRAFLLHQAGTGILFNTLAHPGASGYISISYAGSHKAASHA